MTHIYDVLAPVLGISSAIALLLLVVFLVLGPTRKFGVVLLYVSWELLSTVGLTLADLRLNGTQQVGHATDAGQLYAKLYWTNDVAVDLLRFVLLSVLIYQVAGSSRARLGRILIALVLAVMILPFFLFHPTFQPYPRSAWFNSTSQLLNFGAAILNVILWGLLIQSKKPNSQIVALSIGMGILVTGSATSYGLRHFIPHGGFTAAFNLFLNLIQLCAWLIWCRAFWPARARALPESAVGTR